MILTKQEAQGKWCPMVRAENGANHSFSMPDNGKTIFNTCIASRCMMWRWLAEDVIGARTGEPTGQKKAVMRQTDEPWVCEYCDGTGKSGNIDEDGEMLPCVECEGEGKGLKFARIGYCGLAGGVVE